MLLYVNTYLYFCLQIYLLFHLHLRSYLNLYSYLFLFYFSIHFSFLGEKDFVGLGRLEKKEKEKENEEKTVGKAIEKSGTNLFENDNGDCSENLLISSVASIMNNDNLYNKNKDQNCSVTEMTDKTIKTEEKHNEKEDEKEDATEEQEKKQVKDVMKSVCTTNGILSSSKTNQITDYRRFGEGRFGKLGYSGMEWHGSSKVRQDKIRKM